jgi:hypothetical protein
MSKRLMIVVTLLLAGIACSGVSLAAPAPLSCKMQMLLNGMAAMQRDQGVSRQANTLSTDRDTDLTKKEIKEILDRVYIEKKNKTPDEIKNAVYRACENGR